MRNIISLILLLTLVACNGDDSESPNHPDNGMMVKIQTRAENGVAADGLQAGLFMINYQNGTPVAMSASNNYVHNQLLVWHNDAWQTNTPIYWYDDETPADFYAYAPYVSTIENACEMAISVQTDQRSLAAFAQSDFLWGNVIGQEPASGSFDLTLRHVLSQLTVTVVGDAGFDDDELSANDVNVTIGGTRTNGNINLATGLVSIPSTSSLSTVISHSNGDLSYTAILLPQQIPFSNLIQVSWNGNVYTIQNSFKLEAAKQYNLTVKLKKTKSGFDIGIVGWDIIGEDFGGTIGGE